MKKHEWRVPPILKGAITNADVFINFSLDLAIEENAEFRKYLEECKTWYVRMFPVTTSLLMTDWARTPHELVIMVRHLSSNPFMNHMAEFEMTAPNGTQLDGQHPRPGASARASPACPTTPGAAMRATTSRGPSGYTRRSTARTSTAFFYFDRMLPYWSRYMGLAPVWETPIQSRSRTARWSTSRAARKPTLLKHSLKELEDKVGDGMKKFDTFHFGIHPNATVTKDQCPNDDLQAHHRALAPPRTCIGTSARRRPTRTTTSIRTSPVTSAIDLKVDGKLVYDKGYMLVPAGSESARGRCQVPRSSRHPRADLGRPETKTGE